METTTIRINVCSAKEYEKYRATSTIWYKAFTRGKMYHREDGSKDIYFIGGCLGWFVLLCHEIGHCIGKAHSYLPTIMNPTGLFRWLAK